MTVFDDNVRVLERELDWVAAMIEAAVQLYFGQECRYASIDEVTPPDCSARSGDARGRGLMYAEAVREYELSAQQRLVLMLALAPHLRPQLLDPFLMKNEVTGRGFTEFGGVVRTGQTGFWPTVETAAFILAGSDLGRRIGLHALFQPDSTLVRHRLIELETGAHAQGLFACAIGMGKRQAGMLTTGTPWNHGAAARSPAKPLTTALCWDDLVLDEAALHDVEEIRSWVGHGDTLAREWQLCGRGQPGFRALFYGPPGTGKTLTAALLGKSTGRAAYRVDLSMERSTFAAVFDEAERQQWILFFDGADALLRERPAGAGASQHLAYLLQRLEDFPGLVILAVDSKINLDASFARRFDSVICFPLPKPEQRLALWRMAFSQPERLAADVDLVQIADEFEVSGGAIINVLRHASLMCLRRGMVQLTDNDIRHSIRRVLLTQEEFTTRAAPPAQAAK
jgi:hypothetical protein